jgi:hypothetical protein
MTQQGFDRERFLESFKPNTECSSDDDEDNVPIITQGITQKAAQVNLTLTLTLTIFLAGF